MIKILLFLQTKTATQATFRESDYFGAVLKAASDHQCFFQVCLGPASAQDGAVPWQALPAQVRQSIPTLFAARR
jgi:hypothetical protein